MLYVIADRVVHGRDPARPLADAGGNGGEVRGHILLSWPEEAAHAVVDARNLMARRKEAPMFTLDHSGLHGGRFQLHT